MGGGGLLFYKRGGMVVGVLVGDGKTNLEKTQRVFITVMKINPSIIKKRRMEEEMSRYRPEIEKLSKAEKKAALKGLMIIASIENLDQVKAVEGYIRNYTLIFGNGVGVRTLRIYLRKKLERIGGQLHEEGQDKDGSSFYRRLRERALSLKKTVVSWKDWREVGWFGKRKDKGCRKCGS